MFEVAEIGRKVSKEDYKLQVPELRAQLLNAQHELSETKSASIVIISGIDAAGRGDTINTLSEWLDPRGFETISLDEATDEERERPYFWRFWRKMPARGRMGVFFGGWYADTIEQLAYRDINEAAFHENMTQIRRFENMLAKDDILTLKIWLHISKDEQRKRLRKMEKNPYAKRSVSKRDWRNSKLYDKFTHAAEHAIRQTDSGTSPWVIVEATDARYRDLTVGRTIVDGLNRCIDAYKTRVAVRKAKAAEAAEAAAKAADEAALKAEEEARMAEEAAAEEAEVIEEPAGVDMVEEESPAEEVSAETPESEAAELESADSEEESEEAVESTPESEKEGESAVPAEKAIANFN